MGSVVDAAVGYNPMTIATDLVTGGQASQALGVSGIMGSNGDSFFGVGGQDPSIDYAWSPQQQALFNMFAPSLSGIADAGASGGMGYDIPDPYKLKSMSGALQGYNLPDASTLMPTRSFFESIDPSVMEGMNMMYDDSRNQMFETLGASGLGGSARGGFSGTAGAALGEFQANKARNMMTDLFNMSLPGMAQGYQSEVDTQNFQRQLNLIDLMNQNAQRENIFNMQAQAMRYPYDAALSVMGATLPNPVVIPGSPGLLEQMIPTLPLMAMAMK